MHVLSDGVWAERDNKERARTKEMYRRSLSLKNQWVEANKSDGKDER